MRSSLLAILIASAASLSLASPLSAADFSIAEPDYIAPPTETYHTGYASEIGAWAGWMFRDGDGINEGGGDSEAEDLPFVGLNAKFVLPFASFLAQFDVDAEAGFPDVDDGDNYIGSATGGAHLAWQGPGGSLLGAFGAGGITEDEDDDQSSDFWAAGVEALGHFGAGTLLGQAGYLDSDADDPEQLDEAWFVRAVATAFFNGGRTKLQGHLSYAEGEIDSDSDQVEDMTVIGWGGEIEHQMGAPGFSGYLAYRGLHFDEYDPDDDLSTTYIDHLVMAGFRYRFGGALPADGAPLSLPAFGHWIGGSTAAD